jgi:CRISPR/Cas system-associated endonuclease Cas1
MQLFINSPGTFITQKNECFRLKQKEKVFDVSPLKVESIVISNQAMISTQAVVLALEHNLGVSVITDDSEMTELGKVFGIEVRGLLDLLKVMYGAKRIDFKQIQTLLDYLEYMRDVPYPSFRKDVMIAFNGL